MLASFPYSGLNWPQPFRWVLGDRVQLQQVLMSLMINGIDAIKAVDGANSWCPAIREWVCCPCSWRTRYSRRSFDEASGAGSV
jgi:hypothetical protein